MKSYFYDIENYPNFFLAVLIDLDCLQSDIDDYIRADIHDNIPDRQAALERIQPIIFMVMYDGTEVIDEMDAFLTFIDNPDVFLIGFNNNEYDDIVLNYNIIKSRRLGLKRSTLTVLDDTYKTGNDIITDGSKMVKWQPIFKNYNQRYGSIDLYKSLYETIHRKSLKQTMINLKWYNVLDLPIKPGSIILWEQVEHLIYYCINDVLGTRAFYFHNIKEVKMKIAASKLYSVSLINKNRSAIADALLQKEYLARTGLRYRDIKDRKTFRSVIVLKDIIDPRIEFTAKPFIAYHQRLLNSILQVSNPKILNADIPFGNNVYSFKNGGLHSKDTPEIFISTDEYAYEDGDVTSYYPMEVIINKIAPNHIYQPVFTAIGEFFTFERINAKRVPKDDIQLYEEAQTKADVLKIVINSGIFGKFGYELGWLLDLLCLYKVTINGQLKLLKWVEMLEYENFEVVSVNTDGVTAKVPRNRLQEYYDLSNAWGKLFGLNVEFNEYKRYIRLNVNSYFAEYTNGKVKTKGRFLTEIAIEKGYDKPIVAKALINYYQHNIPIMDTLKQSTDIYDFCMSQKIGSEYSPILHSVINKVVVTNPLQKNIRYYVSTNKNTLTGKLLKHKGTKTISVLKSTITLFNKLYPVNDISEYNIDYNYYHAEIMKLVYELEKVSYKKMKKTAGSMFNEIGYNTDIKALYVKPPLEERSESSCQ